MQTFLPYADFEKSVKCLDVKRLGKQRVEARQMLEALTGISVKSYVLNNILYKSSRWINHPCTKMWKGYELALAEYGILCCKRWVTFKKKDGTQYRDGETDNIIFILQSSKLFGEEVIYPKWLGDIEYHNSHKSNLLRKDFNFYSQFNWDVPTNLEYVWRI